MAKAFEQRPKKADPSWMTAHYHARKTLPEGCCAKCGSTGRTDVHHKDEDWRNNSPDNLERFCRSCHLKEHRIKATCTVCGAPVKGLGFCEKHYQRFKRHGDPLAVKVNQHTPVGQSAD